MLLTKREKRIVNAIYFNSIQARLSMKDKNDKLVLRELNKSQSRPFRLEEIHALLNKGMLCLQEVTLFGSIKLLCLRVSNNGLSFVSESVKKKLENSKKERHKNIKTNQRKSKVDDYIYERNSGFFVGFKLTKRGQKDLCLKCLAINVPCIHGNDFKQRLSVKARPPRKNASKKHWREFLERFAPDAEMLKK